LNGFPIAVESVFLLTVGFHWVKTNKNGKDFFCGLGYWTRANPEQCLLAVRGKPTRLAKDVRRLIVAPRREHSRKPDEAYGLVERLVPGPYLELFARQSRPGWDAIGEEAGLFDNGAVVNTRNRPSNMKAPALQA
jgi:N6-adenosine-specific RNA methylase IME4